MSENVMATAEAAMDAHLRRQANEAIRISQKMDYRGDRTHLPVQVGALDLLALLDRVRAAEAAVLELITENSEYDHISGKMADILRRTAVALKGPPSELSHHSWHDLPETAERMAARAHYMELHRK